MFQKRFCHVMVIVSIFWGCSVQADEFQTIGHESLSMGGAGVASSRSAFAPYYNPALLTEHKQKVNIAASVSAGFREVNVAEHIDNLAEIDIDETIDALSNTNLSGIDYSQAASWILNQQIPGNLDKTIRDDIGMIKTELEALSVRNALQIMPSASLGIQIGNFGIGAYALSDASFFAVISGDHLALIYEYEDTITNHNYYIEYNEKTDMFYLKGIDDDEAYRAQSFEYAIENQLTYLQLTGLAYVEIPLSYAHKFSTAIGGLSCGASLKAMTGVSFEGIIEIDTESEDISDDLDDYTEESSTFGVDLGILFQPKVVKNLSIGLVGKNLNSPEFDTVSGGSVTVDPQLRCGVAYSLLNDRIIFALDADISNNETFIPDYYSQYIGGGINFQPTSWFSIRCGLMQNTQESDEGLIYTGGLGIGFKWLQIDISGQYSSETGEVDGNEIPAYGRVEVAVISKWF